MRPLNPGVLRHRVSIEEATRTQDPATGTIDVSWSPVALSSSVVLSSVPADCRDLEGRELPSGKAVQSARTIAVRLRWFSGLTTEMRVVWEGTPYNIKSISTDVTARREYNLVCVGGVGDGAD